jgi:thiol-disulfide isomerase/thioredoxin
MNLTARAGRLPGCSRIGSRFRVLGPGLLVLLSLLLATAAAALKTPWGSTYANRPRPRPLPSQFQPRPRSAGQVKEFALADIRGRLRTACEWRGRKGVVLFFLAPDCPIVEAYAPEMQRLAARYDPQGIAFYGIHAHPGVTAQAAARHAEALGLGFPVLLDPKQIVAGEAGVRRTPEAVLLAPDGQILYGGPIDASFEAGDPRRLPSRRGDLEAALAAVAADEMPPVAGASPVYGCPLPPAPAPRSDEPVTYTRHIAPILRQNCVACHRPGAVGPFSLLTYRDAARRAEFLREITASRRMPPWKPRPGHGVFLDTLRLTDHELALLARWAEAGAPEGDPADLPPAPQFTEGWQLGRPDYVFQIATPLEVPASGEDLFRSFVIPLPLDADRYVVAFELRPGNPMVVHEARLFVADSGAELTRPPLWEWTPGTIPRRTPPGAGLRLRSGSDLVLVLRFHPSGKPETDRTRLGIYLSPTPPPRFVIGIPLATVDIDIPAGARRHRVVATASVPADAHAYTLMPHAHQLLRELTLTVTFPDGEVQRLLWIDDWDPGTPGPYHFVKPVALPRGTVLELVGVYDNSADNPRNPSAPPRRVRFGPGRGDEMLECQIRVIPDRPQDHPAFHRKWPQGL